jgi:hypothetical protein
LLRSNGADEEHLFACHFPLDGGPVPALVDIAAGSAPDQGEVSDATEQ